MADAVVSYTNVVQGVESDGKRSVEFTIDFDTGDYVTGGIPITLAGLGLKTVNKAFIVASTHVDNFYTQTIYNTSQNTVTAAAFVVLTTPETPLLYITVAGAQHAATAVAATRQFRLRLVGT